MSFFSSYRSSFTMGSGGVDRGVPKFNVNISSYESNDSENTRPTLVIGLVILS